MDVGELFDLSLPAGDGARLLAALAIGGVLGVIVGGWVISALHKLMMGLVKVGLIVAVFALGFLLWKGFYSSQQPAPSAGVPTYSASAPSGTPAYDAYPPIDPAGSSGRWWE